VSCLKNNFDPMNRSLIHRHHPTRVLTLVALASRHHGWRAQGQCGTLPLRQRRAEAMRVLVHVPQDSKLFNYKKQGQRL
jgi:hypothetical protein